MMQLCMDVVYKMRLQQLQQQPTMPCYSLTTDTYCNLIALHIYIV